MLKLIKNEVPIGDIDWVNKNYTLSWFISEIEEVVVDSVVITTSWYTFLNNQISLASAPATSLTVSFFMREEREVEGNGQVTMGDLIDDVYLEIGRKQYSTIYPKERIRAELNKAIWRYSIEMASSSKLQTYWFKWINWMTVSPDGNTVDLSVEATYPLDVMGQFMVGKWLVYNYYDYDGTSFTVSGDDLIDSYDRIIIGNRIPYGVDKISEVYINDYKLEYIDFRDFYMDSVGVFTITRDYQWNSYLFTPYSTEEYTAVIKFIPDVSVKRFDEDVVNVPYQYTLVPVYEAAYRLLASREDERWQYYKQELVEAKKGYKAFLAKTTNKQRSKIGLAPTYWEYIKRNVQVLPSDIYDPYL